MEFFHTLCLFEDKNSMHDDPTRDSDVILQKGSSWKVMYLNADRVVVRAVEKTYNLRTL